MLASQVDPTGGERLLARYRILASADQAEARARDICLEQTVEVPEDVVPAHIEAGIVGRVEALREAGEGSFEVDISYAVECAAGELTQLCNMLFGNISLKPGIRLQSLELPPSMLSRLRGPRFGRPGLRELSGVDGRPLLASALKPMGLSPAEMAGLAQRLARGGIDIVKDDHGLTDQVFCPFEERVTRCAEAVAEVNASAGRRCLYFANISAPAHLLLERAHQAKRAGCQGLVLAPGLVGLDALRLLAEDDTLALPILSHPALLGSLTLSSEAGMAHGVLYGQLMRLAGADATIFPSFGGRFAFSQAECRDLVHGTERPMGELRSIFPVPAGGMRLERIDELKSFYGDEVVLLIGGDLLRQGAQLVDACQRFVERAAGAHA